MKNGWTLPFNAAGSVFRMRCMSQSLRGPVIAQKILSVEAIVCFCTGSSPLTLEKNNVQYLALFLRGRSYLAMYYNSYRVKNTKINCISGVSNPCDENNSISKPFKEIVKKRSTESTQKWNLTKVSCISIAISVVFVPEISLIFFLHGAISRNFSFSLTFVE